MSESHAEQQLYSKPKPLKNIIAIEQSLMVLKQKLSQINKRQSENVKQIERVFYSSIPNLKLKLSQSLQFEQIQEKKKMLFNQSVLRQKNKLNRQRKMINEKEIERNKELLNIMKINERNSIKEMSKKNEIYIQKMKNFRLQQNQKKKQLVKGSIEKSRLKIQDFKTTKLEQLKKLKEEESSLLQRKFDRMTDQFGKLANKENQVLEKVDQSEVALRQLRIAVDKLQKMNQNEFIKLKNKIRLQEPHLSEQKTIEKMLLGIIESSKQTILNKDSRTLFNSRWSSGHLSKKN